MRRSASIFWQVFLMTLVSALGVVVMVGLSARFALQQAFRDYLAGLPAMRGRGMGRLMLGAAEQSFLASVDRSVFLAALGAIVLAAVAAYLFARHLSRPLRLLESAALDLAAGDLNARAEVGGPSEVVELGEAFNHMAGQLQAGEELRRRLVADVAHELRNPIAAARAQAEGMSEGVLPLDTAGLESLVDDMAHLTRLVEDLQELAVAEAGQLTYDMAPLDLNELVSRETERAALSARPGVVVSSQPAPGGVTVLADEQRLSQVLRNLLSNALRHTARGSVTAHVRLEGVSVEVAVVDTGEGIPAEDLDHIFERFYRADTARAADTGGAGLGLAIAARIVRDHGGQVFAREAAGGGAEVGFRLPVC